MHQSTNTVCLIFAHYPAINMITSSALLKEQTAVLISARR